MSRTPRPSGSTSRSPTSRSSAEICCETAGGGGDRASVGDLAQGVALAFSVAALWGVNFVAIDYALESFPPLLLCALRFTLVAFPAVFLLPRPPIPWQQIVAVGATLSGAQFALLFAGIHAGMPAGLASLVLQLNAVVTVGLAVAFLGERPGRRQLVGAVIVIGGLGLVTFAVRLPRAVRREAVAVR